MSIRQLPLKDTTHVLFEAVGMMASAFCLVWTGLLVGRGLGWF